MTSLAARLLRIDEADDGQDPFEVVADGPRLKVNGSIVRARRLLAHGPEVGRRSPDASARPAPEPPCSVIRTRAHATVADILREAMARGGISCSEAGAALDMSEQKVRDLRAGLRPVYAAHVWLLFQRLPRARVVLLAVLEERLRGIEEAR